MDADEARALTEKSIKNELTGPLIKIAHERIKKFASKGKSSCPHPFHGATPYPSNEAVECAIYKLKNEGYKAKWHEVNSTDQREFSYWEISW